MRLIRLSVLVPLLAGLSACVVPVGPEWTDPQVNYPPTIRSAAPATGSVLSLAPDASGPLAVLVVLADQNTKDRLYTRWIIDYPPFIDSVTQVPLITDLPGGSEIERPPLYFAPNCIDHRIASGFSNHRLLFAASDRPFDDTNQEEPDKVLEGNFLVTSTWQFEMSCQ
jgi:hypothetical protein